MVVTLISYCYSLGTAVLLYFFLKKSLNSHVSRIKNGFFWMLFGFIFNMVSFSWFYTTYPIIWLREGPYQLIGIFILQVLVSCTAMLGFFIVGFCLKNSLHTHLKPILFAGTVTLAEYIRSVLLSILFFGHNTSITSHFTVSTLADVLSITPFVEYAYFGGVFSLIYSLGHIVYNTHSKKSFFTYYPHLFVIIFILLVIHYFAPVQKINQDITLGIITTNFPTLPDDSKDLLVEENSNTLKKATMSLPPLTDIIIYPEDARFLSNLSQKEKISIHQKFPKTLFIDGDTRIQDGKRVNVSVFYTQEQGEFATRGKSFIFPFNEYVPYLFQVIFYFFVNKEDLHNYIQYHTYTPTHSPKTISYNGITLATILCSEILSDKTIRDIKKEKPNLIVFQSHLNVFHNNPWFMVHMISATKITSATLRTHLVSSINGSPSLLVSPYGKIVSVIPIGFSTSTIILPFNK